MVFSWLQRRLLPRPNSSPRPTDRDRSRRLTLEALEDRYLLAAPVINAIANVNVPINKSLIVPVTATSTKPVTYTVSSSNPSHIQAQVRSSSNPFLQLTVANFGTMTFELLGDVAPKTVDTIGGLAEAGFYNGLTFHRVIKNFVIQGGDPAGNGSGGPGFSFDDEFNTSALFTGNGQLAMANSGKDTNGSQFFVTVGQQRSLDLNYTIFGQLVRGFDVLTAINSVGTDSDDKPIAPVVITSARLIQDTTDAVLTVTAIGAGAAEVGTITVSAFDGVSTVTKTFKATAVADAINDPPVLGSVSDMVTPVNAPITFPLTKSDLEGSAVFFATSDPAPNATVMVSGNMVTVTPTAGFKGTIALTVKVAETAPSLLNRFDTQNIFIAVGDQALNGSGVVAVSGDAGIALSNVPVATFTDADSNALPGDFSATVNWGDGHVTSGVVTFNTGTFTVSGSNTYTHAGTYRVQVDVVDNGNAVTPDNGGATLHVSSPATVKPTVSFSLASASALESAGKALVQVVLSDPVSQPVTVNYAATDGTALSNKNYKLPPNFLTFAPGQTVKTIPVTILNDPTTNTPTSFQITLSSPAPSTALHLGPTSVQTFSIVNASVSFAAASASGQEGATPGLLKAVLSAKLSYPVTVDYKVTGGTAINGKSGSISAASNGAPIKITSAGHGLVTGDQVFITGVTGNTRANGQFTVTFVDTDTFSLDSSDGTSSGAYISGGTWTSFDYHLVNGTLTFAPGQTVRTIPIAIFNDPLFETNETIQVTLSNPGNAALGAIKTATYTILNNDPAPTVNFSVTNSTASEGSSASIVVTLSAPAGRRILVNFAAVAGTAKGGGVDYTLSTHPLSFAPGQTSRNLVIPITNDSIYDPNETVKVSIVSAAGAIRGSNVSHMLTITDTDTKPTVQFTGPGVSGTEGQSGFLNVTLSAASGVTTKVDYFVTVASTATGGGVDYTMTNGTLTFLPGQTIATIPISLTDDMLDEPTGAQAETVVISLTNPIEATLGAPSTQTVFIQDNDAAPAVNFTVIAGSEHESAGSAVVAVSLSAMSAQTVTVNYAVTGGTAISGSDYTLPSGILTFAPGQTVAYIPITLLYSAAVEGNKTIEISLLSSPPPTNAVLGVRKKFTFTIVDDHP